METLNHKISNGNNFSRVKRLILRNLQNLACVFDFDGVATVQTNPDIDHNGSTLSWFRHSSTNQTYSDDAQRLYEKFYPKSIDTTLATDKKSALMYSWLDQHLNLIRTSGEKYEHFVRCSRLLEFRDGFDPFFHSILGNNIPALVVSAGLGDVIEISLKDKGFKDVQIVSNFFNFRECGSILSYNRPLVSMTNKSCYIKSSEPDFGHLRSKNIILFGDSASDVLMVDNVNYSNLLKIGFCDFTKTDRLKHFMEVYDIVFDIHTSFNYVREIAFENKI